MCGIAGICGMAREGHLTQDMLLRMLSTVTHRGPDERGLYLDNHIGLAHARLSIIDLNSGTQPLHNEDESLWLVYNGEIYNYRELREDLEEKGHRFYTETDGEVVLHLYEEVGADALQHLNGQFALAIWNTHNRELFLARDRCGIRPLYYTVARQNFVFASEIKALFANRWVPRRLDPIGLDQVFTFWTTLSPRTVFENVWEIPPGHYLKVRGGQLQCVQYWDVPLPEVHERWEDSLETICLQTRQRLYDAVQLRLRADVPVGCYLSGGLDSSILTSLVAEKAANEVQSFGIRFQETAYDEGRYQTQVANRLHLKHQSVWVANEQIGQLLDPVIRHCERPILRMAPAPLFALSRLVRDSGYKVVLSGEGADEIFGGYNIFREAKVRRFWAQDPGSLRRAKLIQELYPYVHTDPRKRARLTMFYAQGLEKWDDPLFSHRLRWDNTSRLKGFYSDSLRDAVASYDGYEDVVENLPTSYWKAHPLAQAQYLEMKIFLSNYLLSSQGDRMAMAHSVEIRLPFLDHHLIEFVSRVPAKWKILGLNEKFLLKRSYHSRLPESIVRRPKQPYRAPNDKCFLEQTVQQEMEASLSKSSLNNAGLFDVKKTRKLVQKLYARGMLSEFENMALVGILSTQILHRQFIADCATPSLSCVREGLTVDRRQAVRA